MKLKESEIKDKENYFQESEIKSKLSIKRSIITLLRKENKINYYRNGSKGYFYNINDIKSLIELINSDIKPTYDKNGNLIRNLNISEKYLNDEIMIELFYKNILNCYFLFKKLGRLPELYINYIKNRFDDSYSEEETWYRIKNKIYEKPKCPECGKPVKINFKHFDLGQFTLFCSYDCMIHSDEIKQRRKNTCIERYGAEYSCASKEIIKRRTETISKRTPEEKQRIKNKSKETCLARYGVEYSWQAESVKKKILDTTYKHFGVTCSFKAKEVQDKIKQTNLEKYGAENVFASKYALDIFAAKKDEIQNKRDNTKLKNHTFEKSSKEDKAYELLKTIFPNLERCHKDDLYPFKCDFYDPCTKTYIEFQGMWTHGGHQYDETSEEDRNTVNLWKAKSLEINSFGKQKTFYLAAIKTWTVSDPLKRQYAKLNNLNYIEFWTIDEVKTYIDNINKN